MTPPRAVISWSSGKDCAFALHEMRRLGLAEPVALLSTVNEAFDRVAMHGTRGRLVRLQARAAGLPLIEVPLPWPCPNEVYEARMAGAMGRVKDLGAKSKVFGEIFPEDVRAYREDKLAPTGVAPLFPLLHRDTRALAREMIAEGFEARLVTIDPRRLDRRFAGRRFDAAVLDALPPDVDPRGENGEFHAAVTAGPIFAAPIPVAPGEVIERDGFVYADLVPATG